MELEPPFISRLVRVIRDRHRAAIAAKKRAQEEHGGYMPRGQRPDPLPTPRDPGPADG